MADLMEGLRSAVTDRAELPGMSLMEHLEELRKRLFHAAAYLMVGFAVAYAFHERLYGIIQKPLDDLGISISTTPTPPTVSISISRPPSSAEPSSPRLSSSIKSGSSSRPECTPTRSATLCLSCR